MITMMNGLGDKKPLAEALPALRDPRVERVARVLCRQSNYDELLETEGGVCLFDLIDEKDWWFCEKDKHGNNWVFMWMRFIEQSIDIIKVL